MSINIQGSNLFMGSSVFQNRGLKSTQEKLQRQEKRDSQIAFYENQKENLKDMKCDSLEEIGRKLEMFHSYEDQITAAKMEYNQSQMLHVMDEAEERGEQIAKAADKFTPKTPEERREELLEEALGTDEDKGLLTESMEELAELSEELEEELVEELPEELVEKLPEELEEELAEELPEELDGPGRNSGP